MVEFVIRITRISAEEDELGRLVPFSEQLTPRIEGEGVCFAAQRLSPTAVFFNSNPNPNPFFFPAQESVQVLQASEGEIDPRQLPIPCQCRRGSNGVWDGNHPGSSR